MNATIPAPAPTSDTPDEFDAGPVWVGPVPTSAPVADEKQVRQNELARARKAYLRCTAGGRNKGGSDLVGRTLKALGLVPNKDLLTVEEIIDACGKVDTAKAMAWADAYAAGLNPTTEGTIKAKARRFGAYAQFLAAGGFAALHSALQAFSANRAWTFSETVTINGRSLTYTVDVRRELNDIFGLKLTNARRANFGRID